MIFQMPKRKLTLPTSSRTKRLRKGGYWDDFGTSFFGTLGDPIGTVISLAKGDKPSWSKRGSKIVAFDNRKGFLGGIINSMGIGYLQDLLGGAVNAVSRNSAISAATLTNDPRLLAYKLIHRHNKNPQMHFVRNKSFITYLPTDVRKSGVADSLIQLINNPSVRSFGKKAAIAAASYAIPKALDYILSKPKKPAAVMTLANRRF